MTKKNAKETVLRSYQIQDREPYRRIWISNERLRDWSLPQDPLIYFSSWIDLVASLWYQRNRVVFFVFFLSLNNKINVVHYISQIIAKIHDEYNIINTRRWNISISKIIIFMSWNFNRYKISRLTFWIGRIGRAFWARDSIDIFCSVLQRERIENYTRCKINFSLTSWNFLLARRKQYCKFTYLQGYLLPVSIFRQSDLLHISKYTALNHS